MPTVAFPIYPSAGLAAEGSYKGKRNGIQWTLWNQLDDLDFADDIALLSHNHDQMQNKTKLLRDTSQTIGLRIHPGK